MRSLREYNQKQLDQVVPPRRIVRDVPSNISNWRGVHVPQINYEDWGWTWTGCANIEILALVRFIICVHVGYDIFWPGMKKMNKPLVWLSGVVKTPPFSSFARIEAGYLLRLLQSGESLSLPQSRPLPSIGPRCHELRIPDGEISWRIIYRLDFDAVIILEIFEKKSRTLPRSIIETCKRRIQFYETY
jgi:phage-related protein